MRTSLYITQPPVSTPRLHRSHATTEWIQDHDNQNPNRKNGRKGYAVEPIARRDDPAHRLGYEGRNYLADGMLRGGEDENHLALGVGLAFAKVKIDLGFDISEPVDTLSFSTIYTF